MATRIEASRLLIYSALRSETAASAAIWKPEWPSCSQPKLPREVSLEAMRILGANGYSKDFPVERYYRDAPLVVIGGGTNELQRLIIARNLLRKHKDKG